MRQPRARGGLPSFAELSGRREARHASAESVAGMPALSGCETMPSIAGAWLIAGSEANLGIWPPGLDILALPSLRDVITPLVRIVQFVRRVRRTLLQLIRVALPRIQSIVFFIGLLSPALLLLLAHRKSFRLDECARVSPGKRHANQAAAPQRQALADVKSPPYTSDGDRSTVNRRRMRPCLMLRCVEHSERFR